MHHPTDVTPVVDYWLDREIAQWVHHEGWIRRPIAPWANVLHTELHLAPAILGRDCKLELRCLDFKT